MSNISTDFEARYRMSVLRKAISISSLVDKVTIGPNAAPLDDPSCSENRENERNSSNTESPKIECKTPMKNTNVVVEGSRKITFSVKKILLENEMQRREEVRKAMVKRQQHMEQARKELQLECAMMRAIIEMKREQEEAKVVARLEAQEERLAEQIEMRRKHEQQLQAQRIQERREKLEQQIEEQRKIREREELVNRIIPLKTCFRDKCRDIGSISKACKDRNTAAVVLAPLANRLKELSQLMESVNEKSRSGDISYTDLNIAENITQQSEDILNLCKSEIARIDALYEEEIARREFEMRQAEAQTQVEDAGLTEADNVVQHQIIQEQIPQAPESPPAQSQDVLCVQPVAEYIAPLPETPPNEPNEDNPESVATDSSSAQTVVISEENNGDTTDYQSLHMYMKTHVFLANYAESYRELTKDTSMKKFRFECQKAINIPVNAISSYNGAHLKEKYETLRSLLIGNIAPNVTQHPQGVAFCKDVLAKKIVSQGEILISSKPEMAFPIAAVAVALWNDFPDFGKLLLAHFRRTCPYILPVFLPHLQGQTDEEYYKSLGYKYNDDGQVEKIDKYLTRMSGLMRLYASIIVTKRRRGINNPHPHSIENAWRWLAVTLNTQPRPELSDVCATMILDMLEVAGNQLLQVYPRQFQKMLIFLATEYYPLMKNEAGIGGGPMTRLEEFLKEFFAKKTISPAEGELPPNFW